MAGRPPRALEKDVLRTALEVFCAQGPEAPLKAIGERVGVTASALTQRFGSKQALIQRALNSATLCPSAIALKRGDLEFEDILAHLGDLFARYLVEHVLPAIELAARLHPVNETPPAELSTEPAIQTFVERATQLLPLDGTPPNDFSPILRTYLSTLVGEYLLSRHVNSPTTPDDTSAKRLARLFAPLLMPSNSHTGDIQ